MSDIKTFDDEVEVYNRINQDGLSISNREDTCRMRTALLSCSVDDPLSVRYAINQVVVLQLKHQVSRIIKYTEMMDKIEEKLYESIENRIDTLDLADESSWAILSTIQSRLQKTMIESHKLLEPYLNGNVFDFDSLPVIDNSPDEKILTSESREKIRNTAKAVLEQIHSGD